MDGWTDVFNLVYKAFRLLQDFSIQMLAQVRYLSLIFTVQLFLHVFKKLAAPRSAGVNMIKTISESIQYTKNDTM